ncbi:MAG: ankyrin repeat domain-containing protein, partial [Armatimonadota bacterium]|nr:ankyrin repeat domain-containing protein [Armatimonadota bacterium]
GFSVMNALTAACAKGDIESINDLLANGAKINEKDSSNWTPLTSAVIGGHFDAIKLLVDKGANVNLAAHLNTTPLMMAAGQGNYDAAAYLIDHKADVNAKDNFGRRPLMMAASRADSLKLVQLLLDHHAEVNATDQAGGTALLYHTGRGNVDAVKLLLDRGADVNATANHGVTPLLNSIDSNTQNNAMVQMLLNKGAKPNAGDIAGRTPLTVAVKMHNLDAVQMLIAKGADPTPRDDQGNTLLMQNLADEKAYDALSYLTQHGLDINATNEIGLTALMIAVVDANTGAVRFLLDNGAKTSIKTKGDGTTALDMAKDIQARIALGKQSKMKLKPEERKAMDTSAEYYNRIVELLQHAR